MVWIVFKGQDASSKDAQGSGRKRTTRSIWTPIQSLLMNPHHSASHSQPTHTPPFICVVRREAHDGAWPVRTVGTHSVTYVPVARYTCRSRGHA